MAKVINVNMAPSTSEFVSIFVVLAIPFLYEMSSAFRYHFKFVVYYLYVTTTAIVMIPVMALRPKDCQNAIMASRICRAVSPLLGIKWDLRGEEYFGMEGPCVIVANHQSSLDVLGMFEFWHVMGKCTIVAKKELFYAWPFGLAAWLCGLTFVDRMKSDEAREVMNSSAQLIKAEKLKMWVFPEGTRKNTGELHPFKKGAFHVAVSAQIPIQPVVFSPFYFLDNKERTFNQGKVIITALPPISTEGLQSEDVNMLVDRVRQAMLLEFNRVAEEIYNSLPVSVTVSCKKIPPKSFQTSLADKEPSSPDREKELLETKERLSRSNKEQLSFIDKEKDPIAIKETHKENPSVTGKELTDKGNFSFGDKEPGKGFATDQETCITDKEKVSIAVKEKLSISDNRKDACVDKGQTLVSDKDKLSSHKEATVISDKTSISDREKCCTDSSRVSRDSAERSGVSLVKDFK